MATPSWLDVPEGSHFSLANIPFGIISPPDSTERHAAVAVGSHVLDLAIFSAENGFAALESFSAHANNAFSLPVLNYFAALGRAVHREVRSYLRSMFLQDSPHAQILKNNESLRRRCLFRLDDVRTHVPMSIGDYTDFYAGANHAYNVGVLFRGANNALQPNYTHLPVGYHGRASSIVISGTPVRRPWGQVLQNAASDPKEPTFRPCAKLDFELELAAFVCTANPLGQPVTLAQAEENIFGYVLMNDWSARDVQAWEYVPLGPFGSKNFATTISPWIILADALEPFRTKGLENKSRLSPYLVPSRADTALDIDLQVDLTTTAGHRTTITCTNAKNLLWSFPQMLTHHTITGCPLNVGDLLGSGTISGSTPGSQGSLLEQNRNGTAAIELRGEEQRLFLQDGDTITITGCCGTSAGSRDLVGFGSCRGTIEAALLKTH
ncbi:fumarylacetoacetase [Exophiala oligosperma]|uniref:Fumarylacetoacetase n=1 Tax=Exophiala oligosperma TaxID=215243 RepID=A0A0D2DNE4_9EURO|nr:fumarylacetoacetase [Exophiala oligosperma]KIW44408.1 fumarylacetoacetase [Exophiala oligosperma]